jgi:ABC-2 type transport system ATP-binding protein
MSAAPAAEVQGLSKSFGEFKAVDNLTFSVNQGEMFALVGPDGSGKTTTIRTLCGLLSPTSGSAFIMGHDVVKSPELVKRELGYLSQRFSLYGDLSVDENIEFFAEIHRVTDYRDRREELLGFTRLTPFRDRLAEKLSGGMKQKLALACTLIHTPKVLLLDEPTTGVDPVSRRDFWRILHSLLATGMTILMTTPYLDEAERADRVALMNRGAIIDVDTPVNLRRHVDGEVVEIVCAPVRLALETLQQAGNLQGIQAFGDRLNLLMKNSDRDITRILALLKSAGVTVAGVRTITPSLENVFITLLTRSNRIEAQS